MICSGVASDRAVRTSANCSAVIGSAGEKKVVGVVMVLVVVSNGLGRLVEGSGALVLVVVAGAGWVVCGDVVSVVSGGGSCVVVVAGVEVVATTSATG